MERNFNPKDINMIQGDWECKYCGHTFWIVGEGCIGIKQCSKCFTLTIDVDYFNNLFLQNEFSPLSNDST